MLRRGLLLLSVTLLPLPAAAGLFDDKEARRQTAELREQFGDLRKELQQATELQVQGKARLETLENALRMQLELSNQIEALRGEIARLRGQIEVLQHESSNNQKRQRDFYVDLDTRVRGLEDAAAHAASAPPKVAAPPARDAGQITRDYEAALALFRASKHKEAHEAFASFVAANGDDPLAPSAQYWLGNALRALRDCRQAIGAHESLLKRWPESSRAPDALLEISTCQRELGDAKAARKTLDTLVAKHPGSPAADKAKERLKQK